MASYSYESRILKQIRPSSTSAQAAFTEAKGGFLETIIVSNSTASSATYSIFIDPTGAGVRTEATAIAFAISLAANSMDIITFENPIPIPQNTNVGVTSGTANAITFHFFGSTKAL